MSDLLDRLQDMVDFKHDDMDVAREAIEEIARLRAALATARREGMEGAAKIAKLEGRMGDYYEGLEEGIKVGMEEAAKIAHEIAERGHITFNIAAAIRAAAKEGKMSDVTLQDWPEGVKLRITYRHDKEGPRAITSYAGEWRFFEPVSVKIEPHPEGFYVPARDYDRQAAEIARLRAALATSRREGMEEAAKRLEELHKNHKYDPESGTLTRKLGRYEKWPESAKTAKLEHDAGYYRAISEGVAHILYAAAKEGKP